jgi:hypothetical protein
MRYLPLVPFPARPDNGQSRGTPAHILIGA